MILGDDLMNEWPFAQLFDQVSVSLLNAVVDVILETGNFSVEQDNFNFDICNLDKATVGRIETVLNISTA